MTNKEFKAWFEGFTEALGGLPTVTQWNMIKDKVSKIDAAPEGQQFLYRGSAVIGTPVQGSQSYNEELVSPVQARYAAGKAGALS